LCIKLRLSESELRIKQVTQNTNWKLTGSF
jgi:hypothetical protein